MWKRNGKRGVGKGMGEDLLSKEFEMYPENYG